MRRYDFNCTNLVASMMTLFMTRLVHGDLFEDRTEHERAFSPWWTALEGYTKFSIILVGKKKMEYVEVTERLDKSFSYSRFFCAAASQQLFGVHPSISERHEHSTCAMIHNTDSEKKLANISVEQGPGRAR